MKMKFACAQCLRDGLISEPNKALKHCTAKARHTWVTMQLILLQMGGSMLNWWITGDHNDPSLSLLHLCVLFRWTKERWVLLVKSVERSKWVQVRPLPHAKNFPVQYDVSVPRLHVRSSMQQPVSNHSVCQSIRHFYVCLQKSFPVIFLHILLFLCLL